MNQILTDGLNVKQGVLETEESVWGHVCGGFVVCGVDFECCFSGKCVVGVRGLKKLKRGA